MKIFVESGKATVANLSKFFFKIRTGQLHDPTFISKRVLAYFAFTCASNTSEISVYHFFFLNFEIILIFYMQEKKIGLKDASKTGEKNIKKKHVRK